MAVVVGAAIVVVVALIWPTTKGIFQKKETIKVNESSMELQTLTLLMFLFQFFDEIFKTLQFDNLKLNMK